MQILYDTRTMHAADRYDYFRSAAGNELAPVEVHGRRPGEMLAVRRIAHVGEFEIEMFDWACDGLIVGRRTPRCIRAVDPECYRLFLNPDPPTGL